MAKNDKSADKKGKKGKGDKKDKKGQRASGDGVSIAAHPRAAAHVRQAKGLGGVGFFVVAAYLSHQAGVPADQVALRALAFGIAGYLLAWGCSVTIWRHLILAELRAAVESGRASLKPAADGAGPVENAGKSDAGGE